MNSVSSQYFIEPSQRERLLLGSRMNHSIRLGELLRLRQLDFQSGALLEQRRFLLEEREVAVVSGRQLVAGLTCVGETVLHDPAKDAADGSASSSDANGGIDSQAR
jgi:hypothetical protein